MSANLMLGLIVFYVLLSIMSCAECRFTMMFYWLGAAVLNIAVYFMQFKGG